MRNFFATLLFLTVSSTALASSYQAMAGNYISVPGQDDLICSYKISLSTLANSDGLKVRHETTKGYWREIEIHNINGGIQRDVLADRPELLGILGLSKQEIIRESIFSEETNSLFVLHQKNAKRFSFKNLTTYQLNQDSLTISYDSQSSDYGSELQLCTYVKVSN